MDKAKAIHLDRIRVRRDKELSVLDGEWMKATGKNDKAAAATAELGRQQLRDLPQVISEEAKTIETVEELEKLWPFDS